MSHRNPDDAPNLWGDEPVPALVPIERGKGERGGINKRFGLFHAANPWVYDALVTLARDYLRGGRTKVGMGMLFEVMRWQHGRRTIGDEFKLNNDYRSRYARRIMANERDLATAFEIRRLSTDE